MTKATQSSLPLPLCPARAAVRLAGRLPAVLASALSRWCPVNADGEHLAPEAWLASMSTAVMPGGDMSGATIPAARRNLEINSALVAEKTPELSVVEDLLLDGPDGPIGATRYRAETSSIGLVVFFHGGGFALGSRATHDAYARRLALDTGADVLSVEYRLAPEHPFPAAVDDALAAWRFAVDAAPRWGLDPRRIVVAGDSAGGNLAAVVSQHVRGEDITPVLQLLIYPLTDLDRNGGSRDEFAVGYFLTAERIDWFTDHYVPAGIDHTDPRLSPLYAADLAGQPRAHVVVAGFDPLRDEGLDYAAALERAGVPTTLQREGGLIHGFVNMVATGPTPRRAVSRMHQAVVDALG